MNFTIKNAMSINDMTSASTIDKGRIFVFTDYDDIFDDSDTLVIGPAENKNDITISYDINSILNFGVVFGSTTTNL
jgi:hypothetical protein